MNTLKFRAWEEEAGFMHESVGIDRGLIVVVSFFETGKVEFPWVTNDGDTMRAHIQDVVVMQDTGIRDLHGDDIYEDDIVAFDRDGTDTFRQVRWVEQSARWGLFSRIGPRGFLTQSFASGMSLRVLGNVHQHLNLLENLD